MSLERIVRPFQLNEVFTARHTAPVDQMPVAPQEDVTKSWGGTISGTYTQFALSGIIGGTVIYTEKDRVTQTVRVENPDDSSQFVDVERIVSMRLANDQGNEIHFNLNN